MRDDKRFSAFAVISLVISIIALVFAIKAYDRKIGDNFLDKSENLSEISTQELKEKLDQAQKEGVVAEAVLRLKSMKADVAREQNQEENATEVAKIRQNLEEEFKSLNGEFKEQLNGINSRLEQLEKEIREQSKDAPKTLDDSINELSDFSTKV